MTARIGARTFSGSPYHVSMSANPAVRGRQMNTATTKPYPASARQSAPLFSDEESRWQAVVQRNRDADGLFVYSVKTTGVYCRPHCSARLAKRENVVFHDGPEQ